MIRSLLVGVNGTRSSQAAVRYAIELAKSTGAPLIALSVLDTPHLAAAEFVPMGAGTFKKDRDEAVLATANETIDRLLADAQQQCSAAGVALRALKLEGDPTELLVVESQRVDVLVVGKKHAADEQWELEKNRLRSILHGSSRPVLCIPEDSSPGPHVLVAFDGSLQASKTLQLFVASGMSTGREIHLLTVANDGPLAAQRGIDFLHAHGVKVHVHLEDSGQVAQKILDTADRVQAGLIVLGAYGNPKLREFFFGSVTRTILSATKIPLFFYH